MIDRFFREGLSPKAGNVGIEKQPHAVKSLIAQLSGSPLFLVKIAGTHIRCGNPPESPAAFRAEVRSRGRGATTASIIEIEFLVASRTCISIHNLTYIPDTV